MIELAVQTDLAQLFVQKSTPLSDDLLTTLTHPDTVMTFSDAGAHVSQIVDCSIQTFLLAYWVRERELLPIEDAIRMITMAPAARWGLHGRGMVREGYVADLNVLDPARIGPELPTVEHDLPNGAPRLVQHAQGISATLVAGRPVFRHGEHTGATPGRLIRRQPARA
jgi:N-acyl-D-aspartate/D-glutamate deacylase